MAEASHEYKDNVDTIIGAGSTDLLSSEVCTDFQTKFPRKTITAASSFRSKCILRGVLTAGNSPQKVDFGHVTQKWVFTGKYPGFPLKVQTALA